MQEFHNDMGFLRSTLNFPFTFICKTDIACQISSSIAITNEIHHYPIRTMRFGFALSMPRALARLGSHFSSIIQWALWMRLKYEYIILYG